jgi:hypothetical protein
MSHLPAFTVRAYPSFRPARMFRVVFSGEVIYLIRMKGLLGQADAGGYEHYSSGQQRMMAEFIRWWAGKSIASGVQEVDGADPEELLARNKKNLRLTPEDFASSTLEPASILGHGEHYARWKFTLQDGRKLLFQVEDVDDLKAAITSLAEALRAAHTNKVGWNDAERTVFRLS